MTTSCLEREPSAVTGSAVPVRASRPVELSSTQHGSSAISSGDVAVAVALAPELSRSTVRRGVPCALATSASSVGHELQQQLLVLEQGPQLLDGTLELGLLGLELDARELREAAQLQVEDVGRLGLATGRRPP